MRPYKLAGIFQLISFATAKYRLGKETYMELWIETDFEAVENIKGLMILMMR